MHEPLSSKPDKSTGEIKNPVKPAKSKPRTLQIKGARIVPMRDGVDTVPNLVFKGEGVAICFLA